MRFRLRTLLILLAIGPPMLAWGLLNGPEVLLVPLCILVIFLPLVVAVTFTVYAVRNRRFSLGSLFWFVTFEGASIAASLAIIRMLPDVQ